MLQSRHFDNLPPAQPNFTTKPDTKKGVYRVVVTKVNYISCTNLYSCVLYTIPAAPTCQYSFIRYAVHTIRFSRTYLTNGLPYNHHHAAPVPVSASSFFILVSPSIISFPSSPSRVYRPRLFIGSLKFLPPRRDQSCFGGRFETAVPASNSTRWGT